MSDNIIRQELQSDYPLKPCPICGREVEISYSKYDSNDEYYVSCKCGLYFEPEQTAKYLMEKWNNRVLSTCDTGCSICLIHNNMKCPKMKSEEPKQEDTDNLTVTNIMDNEPLVILNTNNGDWK